MSRDESQGGFATRLKNSVQGLVRQIRESPPGQVYQRFSEIDGSLYAKGIAYNAFFAMFPIMIAIISIIGFVLRDPAVLAAVQQQIVAAFPPTVSGAITETLAGTARTAGLLGLTSLIGLLWSGSALFGAIEKAFSRVYGVAERSFVKQKLIAFGMIVVFAVLAVTSVSASSIGAFAVSLLQQTPLGDIPELGFLATLLSWLISLVAGLALFLAIYRVYPSMHQTTRDILPGALLAAGLFFLLSQLFPLYLRFISDFGAFGAFFGFFFLLLTWLYFVGQIVMLGAVVNAYMRPPRRGQRPEAEQARGQPAAQPEHPPDTGSARPYRSGASLQRRVGRSPYLP